MLIVVSFLTFWFHAKKHIQQGHGKTRAKSAAVISALYTFMWTVEQTDEHHPHRCMRQKNNQL